MEGTDHTAQELLNTTDAQVWARKFMELFCDRREDIDEDLMLTWFANAMAAEEMRQAGLEREREGQGKQPYEIDKQDLLSVLFDITRGVAIGDTLEGSIVFTLGSPERWDVRGQYRVGNLQGQGGVRVIGELV